MPRSFAVASALVVASGAPEDDLVRSLPGFPGNSSTWPFQVYSGMLDVPGPVADYEGLRIHYQLHTSQRDASKDPLVAWHQGGPGGSSMYGLFGEVGVFRVGEDANYLNPSAWNLVANMLYLESPAGSGGSSGFSQCLRGGKPVTCEWDDKSQGEAYAHTLRAFSTAFPEFKGRDLYLAGESYFGIYGPNIAKFILDHEEFESEINLRGLLLGNAAWGGNETCISVNGPSEDRLDIELFFGRGLISPKIYKTIQATCQWPTQYTDCSDPASDYPSGHAALSKACQDLLEQAHAQVGPQNIYNIYDNCPQTQQFLRIVERSPRWLASTLRRGMSDPAATHASLLKMSGGFKYDCGGDWSGWITKPEVQKALHLSEPGASKFEYKLSGPAAVTLFPELVQQLRFLVFSGDADACVPTSGTESWVQALEEAGHVVETKPWSPWFLSNGTAPEGYITHYQAAKSTKDFSFATVRLAGHMVPQIKPKAALKLVTEFLDAPLLEATVLEVV